MKLLWFLHAAPHKSWKESCQAQGCQQYLTAVKGIGRGCCTTKSQQIVFDITLFAGRNCIWYLFRAGAISQVQQAHVGTSDYLHPTDLEAQCCLSGASVFGFALVYVALVCSWVPCSEAQFNVYYAWVPISLCHVFQLQ